MTDAERDEVLALAAWFQRRYPTPLKRLAYLRRAYARWRRTLGIGARTEPGSRPLSSTCAPHRTGRLE
jgi:hypothetical protein